MAGDAFTIVVDSAAVSAALAKLGTDTGEFRDSLKRGGLALETQIKANASGRPGPRFISGTYYRAWNTSGAKTVGNRFEVTVGNNVVYGPRLEFGFTGRDSLNRNYNQPPFPHVAPAVTLMEPRIIKMIEKDALSILRAGLG